MSLREYRAKRNFRATPEPKPKTRTAKDRKTSDLIYIIQRHQARRLHWDLRLEENGVLKSWAVPKEPPAEEGVRRLAVNVEDHTLEYADFEGTIPAGEYGAGKVEIWDKGSYQPLEMSASKKVFEIHGKKLNGTYCLIKLKVQDPKDKNWLFFKLKDKTK